MVKTPKVRHSRQHRDPVTIELGPDEVARVSDDSAKAETETPAAEEANLEAVAEQEAAASSPAEETGEASAAPEELRRTTGYGFAEAPETEDPTAASTDDAGPGAFGRERGAQAAATDRVRERGGLGGRIGAGILGGVVALAGAGLLQYVGLLGAPGGGTANVSLDGINGQIADLKAEITTLKNADDGGLGTRVDGLSAALDQVKADLLSLTSAVEAGNAGDGTGLATLSDKVAEIEKAVAALGEGSGAQPVDLGPLNEKIAALDALVRSAGEAASTQEGRIAALEQSVSELSAKLEGQASQPKIALAIASAALKSALERGVPFTAELDTFAAIAPDAPQIAALRTYAEKGVPARATIAAGMDEVANRMIAADRPDDPDAGFFQRLLSSAESLVKVRPIGAVEGEGVPETVARMEVAVKQGDYAKALAEYESLPEAAKAAGAEFAAAIRARLDAEAQLDALISGAMKA